MEDADRRAQGEGLRALARRQAARRAVTNNRTRLLSGVAKEAFKLRAEIVERSFAHGDAPDLASGPRERAQAIASRPSRC